MTDHRFPHAGQTPLDDRALGAIGELRLPSASTAPEAGDVLRGLSTTGGDPTTTVTSIVSI